MPFARAQITTWIVGRRSLLAEGIITSLEQSRYKSAHYAEDLDFLRQGANIPPRNLPVLILHIVEDIETGEVATQTVRQMLQKWPKAIIVVVAAPRCVDSTEVASSGASACLSASFSSKELVFLLDLTIAAEQDFFIYPYSKRHQLLVNCMGETTPTIPQIERRSGVGRVDPFAHGLRLSPRECDILAGLFEGDSNKALARRLAISDATVKTHVRAVFRKLNARNRTQAIRRVLAACPVGLNVDAWLKSPAPQGEHLHLVRSD